MLASIFCVNGKLHHISDYQPDYEAIQPIELDSEPTKGLPRVNPRNLQPRIEENEIESGCSCVFQSCIELFNSFTELISSSQSK